MRVVCIDDTNRPNDVPLSKWVKKGEPYTIIEIVRLSMQPGMLGFKLEEINLDDCFPYRYFASYRFAPLVPTKTEWAEAILEKIAEEIEQEV